MPKTLAVQGADGAGKKTLIGNLIYKCGLDLNKLKLLEANTGRRYDNIVPHFEEHNIRLAFYAPSGTVVVEDTKTPDILIWVVDVTDPDQGKESSSRLAEAIAGGLVPKEKLLILLNKMDKSNWSEWVIAVASISFNNISLDVEHHIVPISALEGGNLLESRKPVTKQGIAGPEYKTLMELL
ncbi:hypothetical protein B0H63DRAFT_463584 [Podospora didyma]|uniref:ADP-ribosylation factor n=1 Tax=Podospora didyma TaxID=330526 RepID=A0AAE0U3A1_9PEZI|nr:hypothetical protein B0H63DRAFT_463584 [Podospora didyma]